MMHALPHAQRRRQVRREWDALNDVVVAKGTIARMADYTIKIDDQLVATFRADGVIVSTPTGSPPPTTLPPTGPSSCPPSTA